MSTEFHERVWQRGDEYAKTMGLPGLNAKLTALQFHKEFSEVERLCPHLDTETQHAEALARAAWRASRAPTFWAKNKFNLLMAVAFGMAFLLLLAFVLHGARAHAQDKPVTVIPLPEDAKVEILKLEVKQDGLLLELKDLQIKENALQKQLAEMGNQINDAAQAIAVKQNVDLLGMVLDLDKLAWMSKPDKAAK